VAHLAEEKFVARKIAVTLLLGGAIGTHQSQFRGKVIPHDTAARADQFADAHRRFLRVILVQVDGEAPALALELEQDADGVFDIDFQIGKLAAKAADSPRAAEERVKKIEIVNLRNEHAATLVAPGRMIAAVVLVFVPVGHVFTEDHAASDEVADEAIAEPALEFLEPGMKSQLIGYETDEALFANGACEAVETGQFVGDRLLDEEMAARLGGALRERGVQMVRGADDHGIGLGGERLFKPRKQAQAVFLDEIGPGLHAQIRGQHLRTAADAVGPQLGAVSEQRAQIARVALPDAAQAGEEKFHAAGAAARMCPMASSTAPAPP